MGHDGTGHQADVGDVGEDGPLHHPIVRKARGGANPQAQMGDVVGVDEVGPVTGQPDVEGVPFLDGRHRPSEHLFQGLGQGRTLLRTRQVVRHRIGVLRSVLTVLEGQLRGEDRPAVLASIDPTSAECPSVTNPLDVENHR